MKRKDIKEYRIWQAMKARCYAPCNKDMGLYQKKGIKVCSRWRYSFENFLADMGSIPGDDYSIERIDVNGDYCPENCCWIPMSEQIKNTSRSIKFTHNGKTKILKDWAKELGLNYWTLYGRIVDQKMPFEEAIKLGRTPKRYITINGKSQYISDWCKEKGLSISAVYTYISRHNVSAKEALLHYMKLKEG